MTLSKAIELQELEFADPGSIDPADLREAQKLGLEAMKRIRDCRFLYLNNTFAPLPGETPE